MSDRGDRPDVGDKGAEYRHMVGIPGGYQSKLVNELEKQAELRGLSLTFKKGTGSDPDNLGKSSVWIYDSDNFPFYQAEVYHQYHDGFRPGEQYPASYHRLRDQAKKSGKIKSGLCPEKY